MDHRKTNPPVLTDADRDSQTRFGVRPVPEGHRKPFPGKPFSGMSVGRKSIPSPRDQTPLTAKIVVWGGVALGMAGVTAATIMATRKLAGLSDDDDRPEHPGRDRSRPYDRTSLAPRFADMDEDDREAMRRRVRDQARRDERDVAARRAAMTRPNPPKKRQRNIADELTHTASGVSAGLDSVTRSLSGAFDGFRGVASQATGLIGEFAFAADQIRSILHGTQRPEKPSPSVRRPDNAPAKPEGSHYKDDPRTHRL